jgi:hypothetical protein
MLWKNDSLKKFIGIFKVPVKFQKIHYSCISEYVGECARGIKWLTGSMKFKVLTAVTMKNTAFWTVMLCGSCNNRRFGGTYSIHHQGVAVASYCLRCSWLTGSFHPDDGVHNFLQNVRPYKSHTVSRPRRRYSSGSIELAKGHSGNNLKHSMRMQYIR